MTMNAWNYLVRFHRLVRFVVVDRAIAGDAFLKHFSSIYVFVAHPAGTEGVLHIARKELISNKYLFQQASHIGLPAYIQSKLFSPKHWNPPGFTLPDPTNRAGEDWFSELKEKSGDLAEVEPSTEPVPASSHQSSGIGIDALASENKQKKLKHKKKKKKKKRGLEDNLQWLGDKVRLTTHVYGQRYSSFITHRQ